MPLLALSAWITSSPRKSRFAMVGEAGQEARVPSINLCDPVVVRESEATAGHEYCSGKASAVP